MTFARQSESSRWMTKRYALALTVIALLACAAYAALTMVIAQQETTGAVVNISGRQRMLSQRTTLFVQRMLLAQTIQEYEKSQVELQKATDLIESSHNGLTMGSAELGLPGTMSEQVRAMYFKDHDALDARMRTFVVSLRQVLATPFGALHADHPSIQHILSSGPGPLVASLDKMVWQYQREGEAVIKSLQRLETGVLILTLLTLMLEVLLIFRPMVQQVVEQIDYLRLISDHLNREIAERAQVQEELQTSREELEIRVTERTAALTWEIAERKKIETSLRESEQRFRSVAESANDGIVTINGHGAIITWNKSAEKIFQFPEEEMLGNAMEQVMPVEFRAQHRAGIKHLAMGGTSKVLNTTVELRGLRKDGLEFPLELSISSWHAGGQPFYTGILRDISDRKRGEEALQEAKKASERANQAKSLFLANMSHEIRTPMNTIIGMGYLLSQTELDLGQQSQMQKIQSAAENLLGIIDDILDFSKIEAGQLELEHHPFNLHTVLEKVSGMISLRADEKGLEILFDIPISVPRLLVGDALRLSQILINLCTNAVKFTKKGEIVIRVDQVDSPDPTVKLRFSVQDTGIGLSKGQIDGLFQAFAQADASTTRNYGGTGLGLAICKRLVKLMGGEISVSSTPGSGSEFFFTVLFEQPPQHTTGEILKPSAVPPLWVLVVDDNECARQILRHMVEELGFQCVPVCSGEAAIFEMERAEQEDDHPYDVVLLDWRMPCMDGIETARNILNSSQISKSSMIVMVTAFGRQELMKEAREVGIQRVITKPVTPSVLLETILEIYGGYNLPWQQDAATDLGTGEHQLALHGARILVVEDHEINWQVAEGILSRAGVVTERAANGLMAVEHLLGNHGKFDCVLMDLQMPVMDGYEATRRLREKFSPETLPIIAMTAHALKSEQERCLALGMNGYLTKPVKVKAFFKVLSEVLAPSKRSRPAVNNMECVVKKQHDISDLPMDLYGVDLREVLERIDEDWDFLHKLLTSFTRRYANLGAELAAMLEHGDMKGVMLSAHGIKGAAGNISANKIAALGAEIEKRAKNNEVDGCRVALDTLSREMELLVQAVAHWQFSPVEPASNTAEPHVGELKELQSRLVELHCLLQDHDFHARDLFLAMKGQLVLHSGTEAVSQIEQCLASLEFDRGAKIVVELLAQSETSDAKDVGNG